MAAFCRCHKRVREVQRVVVFARRQHLPVEGTMAAGFSPSSPSCSPPSTSS